MNMRLPPIGFWSYARQDDEMSGGKLSALRSLLMSELQQQYGRDPIKIFQDVSAIPPGAEWEVEITAALNNATFLIPIITPAFIQSAYCCREIAIFLDRERTLREQYPAVGGVRRIFPLLYVGIDGVDAEDPAMLEELYKLQWLDFREYRHKDHQSEAVRVVLAQFADGMRHLLQIRAERVQTAAEREALLRQAEEGEAAARRREEGEQAARIVAAGAERARIEQAGRDRAEAERKAVEQVAERARRDAEAGAAREAAAGAQAGSARPSWLRGGKGVAAAVVGLLLIVGGIGALTDRGADRPMQGLASSAWDAQVVETPDGGFRMGNPDAPTKLVQYSSLACDHCNAFLQAAGPSLLAAVRSGRLSWEVRDLLIFPADVPLALLARCQGPAAYFATAGDILSQQPSWFARLSAAPSAAMQDLANPQLWGAFIDAAGLRPVFNAHGLSDERIAQCLGDTAGLARLTMIRNHAFNDLQLSGAPAFFLNGALLPGVISWDALQPQLVAVGGG